MFLKDYESKPKNKYMILLHQCGNTNLQIDSWNGDYLRPSKNITNMTVTVYNINTDRVSDKSVYKKKTGNLFIRCKPHGYGSSEELFLDDFKITE